MPEIKEEKIAAASYVVTFFNDVEALTWQGAAFINMIAQFKEKYPPQDANKMEEEGLDESDQVNLMTSVQNIRSMTFRCYVKFKSLIKQIEEWKSYEPKIKELYNKISDAGVPAKSDVEEFVIVMNELFVVGIIGELLGSAGDVLRKLTG
jgi:hypothetical protein